jgi:hypothetical protein
LVDEPVNSDGVNLFVSEALDMLAAEMGAELVAQELENLVGLGTNGMSSLFFLSFLLLT